MNFSEYFKAKLDKASSFEKTDIKLESGHNMIGGNIKIMMLELRSNRATIQCTSYS
jgi:hypothetical protein